MDYFDDFTTIQVAKVVTSNSGKPAKYRCGAIGVMLRGPAIRVREDQSTALKAPFLYWSRPGTNVCWQTPPGAVRENLWVSAMGSRMDRMLDALDRINPSQFILLENPSRIVFALERMRERFEHNLPADRRSLPVLAEELLLAIQETLQEDTVSGRMAAIVQATALEMAEHPERPFALRQICKQYRIGPDYFRHCFKQYAGTACHDYLLKQRYANALRLLRETELNITEIAEQCAFQNLSLFTRFFKKRSGLSPSEFRKTIC